MNLKEKFNEFPDFPKKGVLFRDFSPILKDPSALSYVVDELSKALRYIQSDIVSTIIIGLELVPISLSTIDSTSPFDNP